MRTSILLVVAGALALSAGTATAQTCAGTAPFSSGPVRLGGAFQTTRSVKSYGAEVAVGAGAGPFASAGLSRNDYDGVPDAGTVVSVAAGYAFNLNAAKTIQLCPHASFGHQWGPDIQLGSSTLTTSANAFAFGGSIGGTIPVTPTLDLVPFGGAAYVSTHASTQLGSASQSITTDYKQLELGAGFVISKMLTLQPAVAFPVGVEGATSTFQIAVALTFGSSKR